MTDLVDELAEGSLHLRRRTFGVDDGLEVLDTWRKATALHVAAFREGPSGHEVLRPDETEVAAAAKS